MKLVARLFKKELFLPYAFLLLCFLVIWLGANSAFAEEYSYGYELCDGTYAIFLYEYEAVHGIYVPEPEPDANSSLFNISFYVIFDEHYLSSTLVLDLEVVEDYVERINLIDARFNFWNFCAVNIHGAGMLYEPIIKVSENSNLIFYATACAFHVCFDTACNLYKDGIACIRSDRHVRIEVSISPDGCFYYSVVRL